MYLENDSSAMDVQLDLTDPDNQKLSHLTPGEVHSDMDLDALDDGTGCRSLMSPSIMTELQEL